MKAVAMKQIGHIFQKDVRHHWLEILFSLAALAAFAWDQPRQWASQAFLEIGIHKTVTISVNVLLPLSWCLLIVRVIQSERLSGERQYWITRPHEWKNLLAAKLLFIVVFINVPLLIVNLLLLKRAGFGPALSYVPQLLWVQLTSLVFLLLPLIALATVTANVVQMASALLAVGLCMAGGAILNSYVPNQIYSDSSDEVQGVILLSACIVTLLWQYRRRKTNRSRSLLAGAAIAILIVMVATPYRALVAREYPQLSPVTEQSLRLAIDFKKPPEPEVEPDDKSDVEIQIPMRVSGIAENSIVYLDGMMLTMEYQNGSHWHSDWEPTYQHLFPGQQSFVANFKVKKSYYEKVASTDAQGRITFAITISRGDNASQIVAGASEFIVPGVGICSLEKPGFNTISCRFPVHGPRLVVVKVSSSETTCPAWDGSPMPSGMTAYGSGGDTDSGPFSSVGTFNIYLSEWEEHAERRYTERVCPGTPLSVSIPVHVERFRMDVDFNRLRLADYRVSNVFRLTIAPHESVTH